jgi:hypothetical protein
MDVTQILRNPNSITLARKVVPDLLLEGYRVRARDAQGTSKQLD